MDAAMPVLQMLISLGAVVAAILGLAWLSRRMQALRGAAGGELQIRASLAVGVKERVVIVRARGQEFLLGVAPGQVSILKSLGPAAAEPDGHPAASASGLDSGAGTNAPPPRFAEALAQQLRQALRR